jgi:hypothetical protein
MAKLESETGGPTDARGDPVDSSVPAETFEARPPQLEKRLSRKDLLRPND